MTAPTLIRQLIEASRDAVTISTSGKSSDDFPLMVGGYVKDSEGNEGKITSLSPFTVSGSTSGTLTPLYPYFNNGSVLKSATQVNTISKKRFPILILDTLDRGETENGMYHDYPLRSFLTMLGKDSDNADQFREVYEKGLNELAEWCKMVFKERMFNNDNKIYRERWGDASQYGRTEKNVFNKLTDAVEITGDFTFNPKGGCN